MDIFDAIRRAEDSGENRVRIDFAKVVFMTSDQIQTLVLARRAANLAGIDLVIVNASPVVREVFNITKLRKLFEFEDD